MVCVDLLGSFTIMTPVKAHSLLALTMIDPANGWFGIVKATNKSATSTLIQDLFHNTWLEHYPRAEFIIFDNRSMSKFKREFKQMCIQDKYVIKTNSTASHNIISTSKCNH
jgi:hypothetical protein